MTPEEQQYFNDYFDMFRSAGWSQLMQELTENANNINSVEFTKDSDDLYFRKGQLATLAGLLNLETTMERTFEDNETNEGEQ